MEEELLLGGEPGPAHCSWAVKSGIYLWSLFFISVITFYGSSCKRRPVPLIAGRAQNYPALRSSFMWQDASASHKGLGEIWAVVKILTLEHEDNYV